MSDYNADAHELDWNEEIIDDGAPLILLQEGDYNFTVTKYERGRFPGGDKIPECKKVTLTLAVETNEGTATTYYDLILWSTLTWKISEFFRAIGQKKHGEAFRPNWQTVTGSVGRAHFKPREYTKKGSTEKRTVNDVSKFYDYDPSFFSGASHAAHPPQQPAQQYTQPTYAPQYQTPPSAQQSYYQATPAQQIPPQQPPKWQAGKF